MGNKAASHLTLFGQTLFPDTLTFSGGFILIAYFFKPYSLNAVFGVMAPELTDSPVDLCLVVPKKTATLEIQLLNAGSTKLMLALLDQFIAGLIADAGCDCPGIRYAANKIAEQPTPRNSGKGSKMNCILLKGLFKECSKKTLVYRRIFTEGFVSSIRHFNS